MTAEPSDLTPKHPDNFDEIFQVKAWLGNYLKEKCSLEHYRQLSLKYFVKSSLNPMLLSKVIKIQMTISRETSCQEYSLESVILIYCIFVNNLEIKGEFSNYLKES